MSNNENNKFKNIDVERLNIVEKNGTIKMSLFNSDSMPSLIFEGEDLFRGIVKMIIIQVLCFIMAMAQNVED